MAAAAASASPSSSSHKKPRKKKQQVLLSWSGGKDSALSLHRLLQQAAAATDADADQDEYEVVALLTTVVVDDAASDGDDAAVRISSHHVRRSLLQAQAAALARPLPILEARVGAKPRNGEYEAAMFTALREARARFPALAAVAFGDLFLGDVRAYREGMLARFVDDDDPNPNNPDACASPPLVALFPLWAEETGALARQCVDLGFRARLVCVDTTQLDAAFAGREYDAQLLAELALLPNKTKEGMRVDPCLENGEAHTFVYDGPVFARPVPVAAAGPVTFSPGDGRFAYCDLVLADASSSSS